MIVWHFKCDDYISIVICNFVYLNQFWYIVSFLAVIFFTEMLGTEEEGKISHVTEIEISERATGKK